MDILLHTANVLYLLSFLMRDILWLRVLTVVAGTCLMPYYYAQPVPLYAAIAWNVLFTAINVFMIWRLLLERRPVQLTDEEARIYRLAFRALTPRELKKLVAAGELADVPAGESLVAAGTIAERLSVIVDGAAEVQAGGDARATLGPGQFVGEMGYLTEQAASAAVVAKESSRLLSWKRDDLQRFLTKEPDLRGALQSILGRDLVSKLRAA